jgi:hypothetical protein
MDLLQQLVSRLQVHLSISVLTLTEADLANDATA